MPNIFELVKIHPEYFQHDPKRGTHIFSPQKTTLSPDYVMADKIVRVSIETALCMKAESLSEIAIVNFVDGSQIVYENDEALEEWLKENTTRVLSTE